MLKHPKYLVIVILIAALGAANPARAWNATGHEVIAEIAWRNLTPKVRDKVLTLLKQHPHFAKRLEGADVTSEPVDYALRVFMRASTWPDMMRSGTGAERPYHHSEWHYIDFPIVAEGTDKST